MADDSSEHSAPRSEQSKAAPPLPTVASLSTKLAAQRDELRALRDQLQERDRERDKLVQRLQALLKTWRVQPDGAEIDVVAELERAIKGPPVKLKSKISKARP